MKSEKWEVERRKWGVESGKGESGGNVIICVFVGYTFLNPH